MKLSNQQIFDTIWQKFIIERKPQNYFATQCYYAPLSPKHVGCAIGCLLELKDAERLDVLGVGEITFDSLLEVLGETESADIFSKYFEPTQFDFLFALQYWHDNNTNPYEGRDALRQIASDFNLKRV